MTGWVGDPTTGALVPPSHPMGGPQPLVQQRRCPFVGARCALKSAPDQPAETGPCRRSGRRRKGGAGGGYQSQEVSKSQGPGSSGIRQGGVLAMLAGCMLSLLAAGGWLVGPDHGHLVIKESEPPAAATGPPCP
jgi:hypothetical protein